MKKILDDALEAFKNGSLDQWMQKTIESRKSNKKSPRKEISDTKPQDCICGTLPSVVVLIDSENGNEYAFNCPDCKKATKLYRQKDNARRNWNKQFGVSTSKE